MTRDELIELISDATTLLGTALAQHVDLTESISGAGVEAQTLKLDTLKSQLADEKLKLAKLKDAAKRKKELEKLRQTEGKSGGIVTLRDASGRTIGFVRVMGPNRTDYFDRKGKLVAREVGGVTYDGQGKMVYRGKLGLVVLGKSLKE
jgi:hypothetical protein